MPNKGYVPFTHHLVKAIADISFPVCKSELEKELGDLCLATKPNGNLKMSELLKKLGPDSFDCATALYCAIAAAMEKYAL